MDDLLAAPGQPLKISHPAANVNVMYRLLF
jgi:hypothetical protein